MTFKLFITRELQAFRGELPFLETIRPPTHYRQQQHMMATIEAIPSRSETQQLSTVILAPSASHSVVVDKDNASLHIDTKPVEGSIVWQMRKTPARTSAKD